MPNIKFSGIIIVLISLYGILSMYTLYLREEVKFLKEKILVENTAIIDWKNDSDKLSKELTISEKKSQQIKKEGDKRVEQILKENVPNECEKAMHYLLLQGEGFVS